MKALAHCFDDEPTDVLDRIGALVRTPAITCAPDTPLCEVRRLLVQHRAPAIAVVERAGAVCGVVTRTDVLRVLGDGTATAEDAMSSFVFMLPAAANVEKAAALMAVEGVGQVLVMGQQGELVGMVSAVDIARYFAAIAGYLVH
jgi:CBS domain-containing protein